MTQFGTSRIIILCSIFITFTIGGFILWATTAQLSSASIANGSLIVESQRKKVQHLQGGWVKAIHVTEGQQVKKGDLLIELANTKADSDYYRLMLRSISLKATIERIQAELKDKPSINWTEEYHNEANSADVINILNNQTLQFQQSLLRNELRINQYTQSKEQLTEQIRGSKSQLKSILRQLQLVNKEITMMKGLLKKGYVSQTKMFEIQRHQAMVESQKEELKTKINVSTRQLVALKHDFEAKNIELKQSLSSQSDQLEKEWLDVNQALKTALDIRSRIKIRSKHTGTIVGLNFHSIGGVVNPGDIIMEIVPNNEELIVQAVVNPKDIDVVQQGQTAKVRLSAYNIRKTPPVTGTVIYVAADRLNQPNEKESGYLVKIQLLQEDIVKLKNVDLYPGMPTDVLILLEKRTLWDYLTAPLFNSYYKAFREQ
ncbi:HlyD family type I secretion periplasmic adaptor subunit [Aliivibrio fischeri]|uniref:HlyD family type I secretion periplasmic adaptor subunit n=1 Tax=Aliivibrio fischeri TaxID=668 RepID=UPI0007C552AD|nr:HlyD family type I secretion periplasmic adaptor subunit [Aliivibrio fischeri]MUK38706.1 HlyD family type I secretion periplasmic adaptor subunit [Aliivibrio fischeri]MUK92731.1 HlyD family type I secretion periplasmic adaptor subunit [Aliivibrio fischeri]MUL04852.1 HlyD family type I secretion periplasmic adaptor subunit [Aliivibrio fischeri]